MNRLILKTLGEIDRLIPKENTMVSIENKAFVIMPYKSQSNLIPFKLKSLLKDKK